MPWRSVFLRGPAGLADQTQHSRGRGEALPLCPHASVQELPHKADAGPSHQYKRSDLHGDEDPQQDTRGCHRA